MRRMKK